MNALAKPVAHVTLPANAALPRLSIPLSNAVAGWQREPHPDIGRRGPALTPRQREEAEAALREVDHLCRSASPELICAWLQRLAAAVRNPPGPDDLRIRAGAVLESCGDFPVAAWTAGSLADAMRTFDWWPSAAQIAALLRERVHPLHELRDGLRRALDAGLSASPSPHQPPDEAAQAAVRAKIAALAAEMTEDDAALPRQVKAKPAPVSDGALLATYEAIGQGDTPRAEALREKIRRMAGVA